MKKKIIIIISCIIIIVIALVSYHASYGYYSSKTTGTATAKVANFILTADENTTYFPYEIGSIAPNSSTEYFKFIVSNKNSNKISEVKLTYTLNLTMTRNIPLNVELYKVSKTVFDATTTSSFNSTGATQVSSTTYPTAINATSTNTFNANTESNDYFVLKLTWNSSYNTEVYQNKIDLIKIQADFQQVI